MSKFHFNRYIHGCQIHTANHEMDYEGKIEINAILVRVLVKLKYFNHFTCMLIVNMFEGGLFIFRPLFMIEQKLWVIS
jgi:hypothetical protein